MRRWIMVIGGWAHGLAIVFASTILYLGVLASPQRWLAFPTALMTLAASLMPLLMTILFIRLKLLEDDITLKRFFISKLSPSKPSKRGWGWMVGILLAGALIPHFISRLVTGEVNLLEAGPLLFLPIGFFIGGLEEFGWRGYLLEKFEDRTTPFKATLAIGILWMVWHWPLFFIEGTYQHTLGLLSAEFISFNASILFVAFIYTFLYHKTNRSILAVMLYHGGSNVLGEVVADVNPWIELTTTILFALVLVLIFNRLFFKRDEEVHQ